MNTPAFVRSPVPPSLSLVSVVCITAWTPPPSGFVSRILWVPSRDLPLPLSAPDGIHQRLIIFFSVFVSWGVVKLSLFDVSVSLVLFTVCSRGLLLLL